MDLAGNIGSEEISHAPPTPPPTPKKEKKNKKNEAMQYLHRRLKGVAMIF